MNLRWYVTLALAAGGVHADEVMLRNAVSKGLSYLAKEGEVWMEERECISCHHLPELIWSHREARARGFSLNETKFNEWLAWANERANQKQHGLEQASMMLLAMPDKAAPDHIERILSEQKNDGSWKPGGQYLSMQKRGEADANANAIRLHLLALGAARTSSSDVDVVTSKAKKQLTQASTPTATESQVFRLQFARLAGDKKDDVALTTALIRQQRGDGGWSSVIGENMSDALATGQVIWALHTSQDAKVRNAVTKAVAWLLRTQRPDGSWEMDYAHISKIDRSAPEKSKSIKEVNDIYVYWGTGWATIGLLQGLPLAQPMTD
ncbi:MAG: hypothetical protein JNJ83_10330 [Verrucomicrobiaceae bacterium]|nr:hypothetical protein [Verrucomicrobiaceae bacterium]